MSANVETMFYVREKPWHGLGTMVQEAPTSATVAVLHSSRAAVLIYSAGLTAIAGAATDTSVAAMHSAAAVFFIVFFIHNTPSLYRLE